MPSHNYVPVKMPYKIVHGLKLCLPIDLAVRPVQMLAMWKTTCQAYIRYGLMSMDDLRSKQKPTSSEQTKFGEKPT